MRNPLNAWALLMCLSASSALAQRAVRPKDAPVENPDAPEEPETPQVVPATRSAPDAGGQTSPAPSSRPAQAPTPSRRKVAPPPPNPADAGFLVKPSFHGDLTDDDLRRVNSAAASLDCSTNPCEGVQRKRVGAREYVAHLRPSLPRLGEVAEVVVEVSEFLDPPDPELGDKKPLEGLPLQAHLEGVGYFQFHAFDNSAGSYGFHFTPETKGVRRLIVQSGDPKFPNVDFDLPIAQAPTKSQNYELHPYEPRPSVEAVGRTMGDLGSAWASLWGIASGQSHGDALALVKTVQRLAQTGLQEYPASAAERRGAYGDLAKSFSSAVERLTPPTQGAQLKAALGTIEEQQCNKCHAGYAWGLTTDVSSWPSFKLTSGEAE